MTHVTAPILGNVQDVLSRQIFGGRDLPGSQSLSIISGGAAPNDQNVIEAGQIFGQRLPLIPVVTAGTNVTVVWNGYSYIVSSTASATPDDQNFIEAGQVFGPRLPLVPVIQQGANVTVTWNGYAYIIAATAGGSPDDQNAILAARVFAAHLPPRVLTGRIEVGIDGHGSIPVQGILLDIVVPFNLAITSWTVLADQSGSIQFDLWKQVYASFPPTVSQTVTGSDKPILSSQSKATSSALTGWTKGWNDGDIVRVNVDSVNTLTRAVLVLTYTRSN